MRIETVAFRPVIPHASTQEAVLSRTLRPTSNSYTIHRMLTCPHCGEPIDSYPDPGGGEQQSYIEDCSVCCRAILFTARFDPERNAFDIEASAEV